MICRQLKVVIWKNFIIRKRHWLLTVIESLLPVALFLMIAYLRSKVPEFKKVDVPLPIYCEPAPLDYTFSIESTHLLYTPNDEFYSGIIDKFVDKFQFHGDHVKRFGSPEKLHEAYRSNHNETVLAIIFNKRDDHNTLDYTIRLHDNQYHDFINTAQLYVPEMSFRPCYDPEYLWKGFLSVQKALDISFMEQISGKQLKNDISIEMKSFPYPPHTEDNSVDKIIRDWLPMFTLFSFIFICPAVLQRVVEEKYSGTKELLMMNGMKSWMLWLGWFIHGITPMLTSVIIIVFLLKVPLFGTNYPPVEYTHFSIIFVFLILYCTAAITFAFTLSTFFKKPAVAMVAALLIWILTYFVPKYSLGLDDSSTVLSWEQGIFINILPNMALHYGFSAMSAWEVRSLGAQWSNLASSGSGGGEDITMLSVFIMLIFDSIFYVLIAMYVDGINPGKYGVKKPWLFPLYSLIDKIRRSSKTTPCSSEEVNLKQIEDGHSFNVGIEIRNLCKRYGNNMAVEDLTLDVYKDRITVLMGHNGAGKSTTMSVITGMLPATSGTVRINGKNIAGNMGEIRQTMGLCPQHNLLFTDLTVKEHLIFFAKLKGKSSRDALEETETLLKELDLEKDADKMALTLSGGKKRKLCLGMALVGGSEVLILDEPSSGMDPESRRELWDLLLSYRRKKKDDKSNNVEGNKTILITTHFLEEAEVLADYLAIMAKGTRVCYGTPIDLKKEYNTGYHLSLMIKEEAVEEIPNDQLKDKIEIIDKINKKNEERKQKIIDFVTESDKIKCYLKSKYAKNLTFVIPFEEKPKISSFIKSLEDIKEEYYIDNISITITSLEDVFFKTGIENTTTDSQSINLDAHSKSLRRDKQVLVLMKKRWYFFMKKPLANLTLMLLAALFCGLAVFLSSTRNSYYHNSGPKLEYNLKKTYRSTTVYFNGSGSNPLLSGYKETVETQGGMAEQVSDVEQEIINKGVENILYYQQHLIAAAELIKKNGNIQATALYNVKATHSSPIALNLVTNAIAKSILGEQYSIIASNHPLESIKTNSSPHEFDRIKVTLLMSMMIPLGFLLVHGTFILFPHMEILTKFIQLQFMCGVRSSTYWLANFIFDYITHVIIMIILVPIIAISFPPFAHSYEFRILLLIFTTYGLCGIPFAYMFSMRKSASGAFALFIILGLFLGVILSLILAALIDVDDVYYNRIGKSLKKLFMIFVPQVGLTFSIYQFSKKAVENYNMDINAKRMAGACMFEDKPCCNATSMECFAYKDYMPFLRENLWLMFGSFLVYSFIIIALHSYQVRLYFWKLWLFCKKLRCKTYKRYDDLDIQNAKLRATELSKTYNNKPVVTNLEFKVKNRETLGILGVNGAGKSTTFRMLTRDTFPDSGTMGIKCDTKTYAVNKDGYIENLGYCPQTDALNYVLTGRQILTVMANLKGVQWTDTDRYITDYLKTFGLLEYADVPCGYYSGGNKRKLNLAIALMTLESVVLLDEPTTGVDPSSQRKCWNLLKTMQQANNLSFILTSHSMVECEALCDYLEIMKDGTFSTKGPISKLKNEHAGFSVKLKLKGKLDKKDIAYDEVDSLTTQQINEDSSPDTEYLSYVQALKEDFWVNYNATVKDEHTNLLHFYITKNTMRWSKIFEEIEDMKVKHAEVIEDYAISEASLEDVFLSVARSSKIG